jgi:hypothetical protein
LLSFKGGNGKKCRCCRQKGLIEFFFKQFMRKRESLTEGGREPAVIGWSLWGKPFPKDLEIPLVSRAVYGKEDGVEIKAIPFLHQYPVKIRGHLVRRIPKYAAAPGA